MQGCVLLSVCAAVGIRAIGKNEIEDRNATSTLSFYCFVIYLVLELSILGKLGYG